MWVWEGEVPMPCKFSPKDIIMRIYNSIWHVPHSEQLPTMLLHMLCNIPGAYCNDLISIVFR